MHIEPVLLNQHVLYHISKYVYTHTLIQIPGACAQEHYITFMHKALDKLQAEHEVSLQIQQCHLTRYGNSVNFCLCLNM